MQQSAVTRIWEVARFNKSRGAMQPDKNLFVFSNKVNPAQIGDRQNGLDGRPCESCFSKLCRMNCHT